MCRSRPTSWGSPWAEMPIATKNTLADKLSGSWTFWPPRNILNGWRLKYVLREKEDLWETAGRKDASWNDDVVTAVMPGRRATQYTVWWMQFVLVPSISRRDACTWGGVGLTRPSGGLWLADAAGRQGDRPSDHFPLNCEGTRYLSFTSLHCYTKIDLCYKGLVSLVLCGYNSSCISFLSSYFTWPWRVQAHTLCMWRDLYVAFLRSYPSSWETRSGMFGCLCFVLFVSLILSGFIWVSEYSYSGY